MFHLILLVRVILISTLRLSRYHRVFQGANIKRSKNGGGRKCGIIECFLAGEIDLRGYNTSQFSY